MAANPDGCVIPMLDGAYVKLGACDDKSSLALLLLALVLSLCTAKSCCVLRGSTQRIMASAAFSPVKMLSLSFLGFPGFGLLRALLLSRSSTYAGHCLPLISLLECKRTVFC